jgi:hypothetical protein
MPQLRQQSEMQRIPQHECSQLEQHQRRGLAAQPVKFLAIWNCLVASADDLQPLLPISYPICRPQWAEEVIQ